MLHTQLRLISVRSLSPPFLLWFTPAWQQPSSKLIHTGRSSFHGTGGHSLLQRQVKPKQRLWLDLLSLNAHSLTQAHLHTTRRLFFKFRNLRKYLHPSSQNIASLSYDHPEVITLRLTKSRLELKIKTEISWNMNLLMSRKTPDVPDNGYNTNTKNYAK